MVNSEVDDKLFKRKVSSMKSDCPLVEEAGIHGLIAIEYARFEEYGNLFEGTFHLQSVITKQA